MSVAPRWRRRAAVTTVLWLVLCLLATWLRMRPAVVVLAGIVAVVALVAWTARDVGLEVQGMSWTTGYESYPRSRGADTRLAVLRRRIFDTLDRTDATDPLHAILVPLVDERLASRHGIDRQRDPVAAERLLGPELASYVQAPPEPGRVRNTRHLSDLLSRIESL